MKFCFPFFLFLFFTPNPSFNAKSLLEKVNKFGNNPGKLDLFVHPPKNLESVKGRSLVVVLHGCNQTALAIAKQSGWCDLADTFQFMTIFPQQRSANNPNLCFNWFREADAYGEEGEAASVRAMIEYTCRTYGLDSQSVFVYGVSAGAMMTSSLLTMHPNEFKAGAVLAGGPFIPGLSAIERMKIFSSKRNLENTDWVVPVRNFSPSNKSWPKLLVLHGQRDFVVSPENAKILKQQWLDLNGVNTPNVIVEDAFSGNPLVQKSSFLNTENNVVVILYEMQEIGHALPIDPGPLPKQGGQKGVFAVDKDFFSTYYILKDFGLAE